MNEASSEQRNAIAFAMFVRHACPPDRVLEVPQLLSCGVASLLPRSLALFRDDVTRGDCVDRDAQLAEVARHLARHADHRRLAASYTIEPGAMSSPWTDEILTMRPPSPDDSIAVHRTLRPGTAPRSAVHALAPGGRGHVHRASCPVAIPPVSVLHQDVEPAELGDRPFDHRLRDIFPRNIPSNRDCVASGIENEVRVGVSRGLLNVDDEHAGAVPRQPARRCASDAERAARNNR